MLLPQRQPQKEALLSSDKGGSTPALGARSRRATAVELVDAASALEVGHLDEHVLKEFLLDRLVELVKRVL